MGAQMTLARDEMAELTYLPSAQFEAAGLIVESLRRREAARTIR